MESKKNNHKKIIIISVCALLICGIGLAIGLLHRAESVGDSLADAQNKVMTSQEESVASAQLPEPTPETALDTVEPEIDPTLTGDSILKSGLSLREAWAFYNEAKKNNEEMSISAEENNEFLNNLIFDLGTTLAQLEYSEKAGMFNEQQQATQISAPASKPTQQQPTKVVTTNKPVMPKSKEYIVQDNPWLGTQHFYPNEGHDYNKDGLIDESWLGVNLASSFTDKYGIVVTRDGSTYHLYPDGSYDTDKDGKIDVDADGKLVEGGAYDLDSDGIDDRWFDPYKHGYKTFAAIPDDVHKEQGCYIQKSYNGVMRWFHEDISPMYAERKPIHQVGLKAFSNGKAYPETAYEFYEQIPNDKVAKYEQESNGYWYLNADLYATYEDIPNNEKVSAYPRKDGKWEVVGMYSLPSKSSFSKSAESIYSTYDDIPSFLRHAYDQHEDGKWYKNSYWQGH